MSDDLFFIPMIARALRESDPRAAMVDAFEQMRAMGKEPRYRRGYQQLLEFMDSAFTARWEDAPEELGALILRELDRPTSVELIVERNDDIVASCSFEKTVGDGPKNISRD